MAPRQPSDEKRVLTDGGVSEDAVENLADAITTVQEHVGTISEEVSELEEAFGEAADAAEDLEG